MKIFMWERPHSEVLVIAAESVEEAREIHFANVKDFNLKESAFFKYLDQFHHDWNWGKIQKDRTYQTLKDAIPTYMGNKNLVKAEPTKVFDLDQPTMIMYAFFEE